MMSTSEARSWQQTWQEKRVTPNTQVEQQREIHRHGKKRWITPGEKIMYSVFSAITICALIFTVSFSSMTDTLNRDVQQLETAIQQQQTVNENLQYKVKEYSNPDRILRIAKENGLKIQNTRVKQASEFNN